jgi:hypothetical protein
VKESLVLNYYVCIHALELGLKCFCDQCHSSKIACLEK